MQRKTRKIIQIDTMPATTEEIEGAVVTRPPRLFALTDDGEVLVMELQGDEWHWEVVMDGCPQEPLGHETDEEFKERWGGDEK